MCHYSIYDFGCPMEQIPGKCFYICMYLIIILAETQKYNFDIIFWGDL